MKNSAVLRVGLDEPLDEFAADFIRGLPYQRPDGGDHAVAPGAELFHRLDGGFQNAGERAFPSRMRRSDHPRARVGEQDRAAIGGGSANGKAFGPGDDGVGHGSFGAVPWPGRHDDIGRMDLPHIEQTLGRDAHLLRHPPAVFGDVCRVVLASPARR